MITQASIQLDFSSSDNQIIRLCSLYWESDTELNFRHTSSHIAQEFGISSSKVLKTVKEGCQARSSTVFCTGCGKAYIYTSRSDFQGRLLRQNNYRCSECVADDSRQKKEEQQAELETKKQIIQDRFASMGHGSLELSAVSLENSVYLLSFIRLLASESLTIYAPLEFSTQQLSPDDGYDIEIINQLFQEGLIVIHSTSSPNAFIWEDGEPQRFYTKKVIWSLFTGDYVEKTQAAISNLEKAFRTHEWPASWHLDWLPLCKKIALYECLEYLKLVLEDHSLPFNPGEKTKTVISNLLENYSVGQIYNLIWGAGRDAAAFYMREKVPKTHAANTVVGALQRKGDHARAEGWELKIYRRDRRCPQSMISHVFFDRVLQIGDRGFDHAPSVSALLEK